MANTTMTRQSRFAEKEQVLLLQPVGGELGLERPVVLNGEVVLGREAGRRVQVLDDEAVSRKHAVIRWLGEQGIAVLEDLKSKNGTFVNGEIVVRKYLEEQDVVRVGDHLFVVEVDSGDRTSSDPIPEMVGNSATLHNVKCDLALASPGQLPVLLLGETGTGKEVAARAVHRLAGRAGDFVPVNCAGVPEALFESLLFGHAKGAFTGAADDAQGLIVEADGGTLFLDEVGEMPQSCQSKLLRFLEDGRIRPVGGGRERRVDVRVVAATNAPLRDLEKRGVFRSDLLARLEGITVVLPPLRHRRRDIPTLLQYFAAEHGWGKVSVEPDTLEALLIHSWDWNVRQLRQMVARWSQMAWSVSTPAGSGPTLSLEGLDVEMRKPVVHRARAAIPPMLETTRRPSGAELLEALVANEWSIQRVAEHFGKDRKQIYRWMERHGIERKHE